MERARKGLPLEGTRIIDAHGHLGEYFNFHIPQSGAEGMIRVMDRLGIDQICVSAHTALSADYRRGNDAVASAIRSFPGRFVGYAVINPNYPDDVGAELERCFDELGMRLIKLHPALHKYPLTGKNYEPVWDYARRRGCAILIHTWKGDANCDLKEFSLIAAENPEIPLICGHAGGPGASEEAISMAQRYPNVYIDLTGSYNRWGAVEEFVRGVGADRVLYGSDMPFLAAGGGLGKVVYAKIDDAAKRKILGGNMAKLLGDEREDL
ncbi:MAG: amidohydrolase family protein [bacterium]